jgi:hypothetical protein
VNNPGPSGSRPWRGLGIALTLSALLLIASTLHFVASAAFLLQRHYVLRAFEFVPLMLSPVGPMILGFVVYVVAAHAAFGLLVWWVARAWQRRLGAPEEHLRLFVIGSWALWGFALLFANAGLSPWSDPARYIRDVAELRIGPWEAWQLVVSAIVLTVVPAVAEAIAALRRWPRAALGALAAVAFAVGVTQAAHALRGARAPAQDRPNVIIVGIDSLRLPWVGAFGGEDTPNIDAFTRESVLFDWSYSPLARTFAAWMSILTGQMPRANGVRENVMPPSSYSDVRTLADELRDAGYRTVFAMDEVRFAPIDETLGFDQLIGPPIGAHDFLLATIADVPITNVLVNSPLGGRLLPTLYANRTAAVSYEPESFDEMLWDGLETDGRPLFFAVHFTLPHYPVYWASAPRTHEWIRRPDVPDRILMREQLYRASTRTVDAQVGRFLAEAERRGLLDNAIVVMLSDHGEAVGLPEDDGLQQMLAPPDVKGVWFGTSRFGHGTATTSPRQFETLLAFRRYGGGERWQGRSGVQTSLIDVAPTLLSLIGEPVPSRMGGADLSAILRGEPAPAALVRRILFTETGYSPPSLRFSEEVDERKLFLESVAHFHVDYARGRIQYREEQIPKLLMLKERAALAPPWVLSAIPSLETRQMLWVLYNSQTGEWVRYPQDLALMPGAPPATLMEAALLAEYPKELSKALPWPEEVMVTLDAQNAPRR